MKKRRRVLLYTFCGVLWLAAVGTGLEVFAAFRERAADRAAEAYGAVQMAKGYQDNLSIVESTASEAPEPPPGVKRAVLSRETFAERDEAGRLDFVTSQRELALVCDREGKIVSVYASPEPAGLAELAARARVGGTLSDLLPLAEGRDARVALGSIFASGVHLPREYTVPMSAGRQCLFEFLFYPLKEASGRVTEAAVFARDSIWEKTWIKFRPHVYRAEPFEFWTNSLGWRDEEVVLPKPPGVYRIACIGGSTTAQGPRNDLTYPNLLERQLRERLGTDQIEVVNCGVFALTSAGEVERLPDYEALEPDLIVHYNFVNDVGTVLGDLDQPLGFLADPVKAIKGLLRHSRFLYRYFNWQLLPSEATLTDRIQTMTVADLERICHEARQAGVDVAVCSFACPDIAHLDRNERAFFDKQINNMVWGRLLNITSYVRLVTIYNRFVKELCEKEGILYIPVAENITGGTDCFSDICHLFLKAMDRQAEIVSAHIEDRVASRMGPAARAERVDGAS